MAVAAIAELIGYSVTGAPEAGFGIVVIAASARAKLMERTAISAEELHTLATLAPARRAPIKGGARGEVAYP